MNTIRIGVSVSDLNYLTEIAPNTYEVIVSLLDNAGQVIVNPNLPASPYTSVVETTSTNFNIDLPVADANYPVDVVLKIEGMPDCCNDQYHFQDNNLGEPRFAAEYIPPSCSETGQLIPARYELTNIENVSRFKVCYNELNFDNCGNCEDSTGTISGSTHTVILDSPSIGQGSKFVILRGYNGPTCQRFFTVTTTISPIECITDPETPTGTLIPNICNSHFTAEGIGGIAEYYWINNTASPQPIYWEWDTNQYPDRFQVFVDNAIWLDTFCAGPLPNSCTVPGNCQYQDAKTYGLIELPVGSTIEFKIDGDCSGTGGTVWTFQTSCSAFAEPPIVYTGAAAVCAIEITQSKTLAGGRIYVDRWTGALSGQYEFGIQLEASADYNTVSWMQDYVPEPGTGIGIVFDGLTTGSNYRVWIRDKNNPTCNSFITITSL